MEPLAGRAKSGMVLAVHTAGAFGEWIRLGSALIDETSAENHIAVLHHYDPQTQIWWGIEGRPGGVGWRDCGAYLNSAITISNVGQPLTGPQRTSICNYMLSMVGTPYDWGAIAEEALRDLSLPLLFATKYQGEVPGHVICSSVAAYAYKKAGAVYPQQTSELAYIQPADWAQMIVANGWQE